MDRNSAHHLHVTTSIQQYFNKCNIKIMPQSPYNPNFTLCNFWLLLILKSKLHGGKFHTDCEVISVVQNSLKLLPEKDFSTCFEKWIKRLDSCVSSEWKYFEKEFFFFSVNSDLFFMILLYCYGTSFVVCI